MLPLPEKNPMLAFLSGVDFPLGSSRQFCSAVLVHGVLLRKTFTLRWVRRGCLHE